MQNARSHSSVFKRPIQVCECAFALHQDQKRDHLGAVAIDIHLMFRHDLTEKTPSIRPGLDIRLPHIQGVHRNLRTNPLDPSSPLQKLTQTVTLNCFMHTAFYICLVLSASRGLYSFRAQDKAERLSPVDPGISRGVTDLYPSRGYHPVIRAIDVSRRLPS